MKNFTRSRPKPHGGFTLIELLVVVTIIVVLLALLTPALDKAIYMTEVTVCGAQLDGVGTGATSYAMNNKRSYPHRAGMKETNSGNYYTRNITLPFGQHSKDNVNGYDDRPIFRPYIQIKALQCPPAGEVDLDQAPILTDAPNGTMVFSSYSLWFGWQYVGATYGGTGMFKMGQKWSYKYDDGSGPKPRRYAVLAGDYLVRSPWVGGHNSSHNDRRGSLTQFVRQNQGWNSNIGAINATISDWRGAEGDGFDVNYAFDDGSVRRFDDVRGRLGENQRFEPRFDLVAEIHKSDYNAFMEGLAVPSH